MLVVGIRQERAHSHLLVEPLQEHCQGFLKGCSASAFIQFQNRSQQPFNDSLFYEAHELQWIYMPHSPV